MVSFIRILSWYVENASEEQQLALQAKLFGGLHVNTGINFEKYDEIDVKTRLFLLPLMVSIFLKNL